LWTYPLVLGTLAVHDLLCKIGVGGGLARMGEDEYHKVVLI